MSSDWWSRKLSNTPQPSTSRSTPPSYIPPSSPPLRFPTAQPQGVQVTDQNGRQTLLRPDLDPKAEITFGEALKLWKGGEAMRKQGDMSCPECGSPNVFIRSSKSSSNTVQGNSPAPRCFECGWNGLYDQASQSNWTS